MAVEIKAAVTVGEMAQMVGLSRARFYQLIGKTFPFPVYDVATRRPFYDEQLQNSCLEVRHTGRGIDGRIALFNVRRSPSRGSQRTRTATPERHLHEDLLSSLRSLGLVVLPAQIDTAIKTLFPQGTKSVEASEVVRSVFIHLKSKGT